MTRAVIHVDGPAELMVAGLPLFIRSMLTLASCGITRFCLITEPTLQRPLARDVARWAPHLTVSYVTPGCMERLSLASQRVVVVRTAALFSAKAINMLLARAADGDVVTPIPASNGAEAGIMVLSGEHYIGLRSGIRPEAEIVPAPPGQMMAVTSVADVPAAERLLFSWSVKETDGFISRHLNRPISTWISRRLSHFDIAPGWLTAFTAVLAGVMFMALLGGTPARLGWGCLCFHLCSVADGLDGEIARAKFKTTALGAGLDTAADMATNLLFVIGISAGDALVYGDQYLWLGGGVFVIAFLSICLMAVALRLGPGGGSFDVLQLTIRRRLVHSPKLLRTFGVINAFMKRDLFAFAFAVAGCTGHAYVIPWVLCFGTTVWLGAILVNFPFMLRLNRTEILPRHIQDAAREEPHAPAAWRKGGARVG